MSSRILFMRKFCSLLLAILLFMTSCVLLKIPECPYEISDSQIDFISPARLSFVFFNGSLKEIESFTVLFSIHSEDEDCFIMEDNRFYADFAAETESFSSEKFEIFLEDYLSPAEDSELEIDNLYVTKIRYKDGTVWKDEYGIFGR